MIEKKRQIDIPYNFIPKFYQLPILEAFDNGFKNFDIVMHRRSGKDKVCLAILAKAMATRKGAYYYIFPEFNQGRKALWDNIDGDEFRTLKHIPEELWSNVNNHEMKLTIKNGSYLQVIGSNNIDSIVGSNPVGLVYSEWSLQDPKVKGYLEPIIKQNGGFQIFNYTPRGNNHARKFHEIAENDPNWFSIFRTAVDTQEFNSEELEKIRMDYVKQYGSDALFNQEYLCSFDTPVLGAIYLDQVNEADTQKRISTNWQWDKKYPVNTDWDLGFTDPTCIVFSQNIGNDIRIIDYYENVHKDLKHYIELIESKPYKYRGHFLPHDGGNDSFAIGKSTVSLANMIKTQSTPYISMDKFPIDSGIEVVKSFFYRFHFNSLTTQRLIEGLKAYKSEYVAKYETYKSKPVHDWSSHIADALRGLALRTKYPKDVEEGGFEEQEVTKDFIGSEMGEDVLKYVEAEYKI